MSNFFKSIFSSKQITPEEEKKKADNNKFEIFKYDGIRAQNMGKLDYAVKCYREALRIRADDETEEYLGQALSIQGKTEEAFDVYNQLAKRCPDKVSAYLALANVCFLLDKYQEMLNATMHAIQIDEKNAGAYLLQGKAHLGLKNEILAVADLTKAIVLRPDYTEALLVRADVFIAMAQQTEATKDIDVVLSQNESDEEALLLKGKLYESLDKEEEAEKVYRSLIDTDPFNEQAYLNLGKLLMKQYKMDEAISLFDDAIEMNPKFAGAYHERGKAKLLNGDKDGSIEDVKKSIELNPKEIDISGQFENQEDKPINILGIN